MQLVLLTEPEKMGGVMVTQRGGRVCQQVTEMRPNTEKKGSATVFINSPKHDEKKADNLQKFRQKDPRKRK